MDWSSSLKNLFTVRQNIANATNQTDLNKAKKEEKELLSNSKLFDVNNDGKVDIEDLVSFSTLKKDVDGDNDISDEEKTFFDDVKDMVYDLLAKNINKNKNLKVSDMLKLEEQIRELDSTQKEVIGSEMEKLQNRMVSNLTAQFFVTKETASYKENSKNGMLEIWEAQAGLAELNESANNPFNNKLEVLLDKLESRATRTLSEDYTSASIQDAKDSKDMSKLVKKTSSEGEEELDMSKFSFDGTTLKYDGKVHTGDYQGKYYEKGILCDGLSLRRGQYYVDGELAETGVYPHIEGSIQTGSFYVENGKIVYEDKVDDYNNNTVRTYYESYITYYEAEDGTDKVKADSVIKERITFVGSVETGKLDSTGKIAQKENYENGKLVSTDTYEYNSDGSYSVKRVFADTKKEDVITKYTTTGEVFDGNGVYDGKLYKDNKLVTGVYGGRYYVDGVMPKGFTEYEGIKYLNGEVLTGICGTDGKYYEDGVIKALATSKDGKVYTYGVLANGVVKEEDGSYSYYVAGIKEGTVDANVAAFITDPANNIQNVVFPDKKEDGSIDFSHFKGIQYSEYAWRDVEFNGFTDANNYTRVVNYANDIKYSCEMKDGILKDAKYILGTGENAVEVDVNEDGNKQEDKLGIDYSINFTDIDGSHPKVTISNALANGLTYVTEYNLTDGKYVAEPTKLVLASINDIQTGKAITAYTLDEGEDGKLKHEVQKDEDNSITGVKLTDTRIEKVTAEQTFGANGKLVSGVITFAEPAEGANATITLDSNASYKVDKTNNRIIVTQIDGTNFVITTYNNDGTMADLGEGVANPKTVPNNNAEEFAKSININMNEIEDIEFTNGVVSKITIDNVEYNVTITKENEKETITLTADENTYKSFINGVVVDESSELNGYVINIKRNEEGKQTFYKMTQGDNIWQYEYEVKDGQSVLKKVTEGVSDAENSTYTETVENFAADGKTIITSEVVVYNGTTKTANEIKTVTKYAGSEADNVKTYEKEYTATGYEETTYDATTQKPTYHKKNENSVITELEYKADGETVSTRTVTASGTVEKYEVNSKEADDIENGGRLIEKTEGIGTENRTVTKYTYSAVSDTVTSRTVETYGADNLITKAQTYDGAEGDSTAKLQSEIEYTKGIKSKETKITYNEDGSKATETIQEYDGNFVTKVIVRTYAEDGTYTEKVGSAEDRFDANGNPITKEQLQFAASLTPALNITDVEYSDEAKTVVSKIIGTRFNQTAADARKSTFSDWSVSSDGKYTYTEEVILAENNSGKADDVVFQLRVEDNVQKSAKIVIDGKSYNVNVNGAELNGNLDTSISTWKADENATKIYVADALFDGITRQRIFTKNDSTGKYELSQIISIGTIEEVQSSSNAGKIPQIEIPTDKDITTSKDGNTITIPTTLKDGKYIIPVHLGSSAVAYSIELKGGQNETFTISDGKITSQYKDGNKTITTTYTFNKDGGYTKTTSNGVGLTYNASGVLSAVKIGDMNITEGFSIDNTNNTVTVGETSTEKVSYEMTYSLTDGKVVSGKVKFGTEEIALNDTTTAQFSADGKSVTIVDKKSNDLTITSTRNADGTYTALKLNNVEIDVTNNSGVVVDYTYAKEVQVDRNPNATNQTLGYTYIYSLENNNSLEIGGVKQRWVLFNNSDPNKSALELSSTDELTFADDYKECTIKSHIDNSGTFTRTLNASGDETQLVINNKTIDLTGCTLEYKKADGTVADNISQIAKFVVTKAKTATEPGYVYTYTKAGELESCTVNFVGSTSKTFAANDTEKVTSVVINEDKSCTAAKEVAGLNVTETYSKEGALTKVTFGGQTFDISAGSTLSYDKDNKTATITTTTDPKYTMTYSLADASLKSGKLFNSVDIGVGATVVFNKNTAGTAVESVTVTEKDSNLTIKYTITGTIQEIKIGNTVLGTTNPTYLKADGTTTTTKISEAKFIKVTRAASGSKPQYEIIYNLSDGTIKSGTYGSINMSSNDVLYEGKEYITISDGTKVSIYKYSDLTTNLNSGLNISAANIDKFNAAVKAVQDKISFANIKQQAVTVNGNTVSFTYNNNNTDVLYTINLNTDNTLASYTTNLTSVVTKTATVTGLKAKFEQTGITCTEKGEGDNKTYDLSYEGKYTVNTIYNSQTNKTEKQIVIGGKTFKVPENAEISVAFDTAKDGTLILTIKVTKDGKDSYFELKSDKSAAAVTFSLSKIVQNGTELILDNYSSSNVLIIQASDNTITKQ